MLKDVVRSSNGNVIETKVERSFHLGFHLLIPELVKIEGKRTLLILHLERSKQSKFCLFHKFETLKWSLFIPQIWKIEAVTWLIPETGKIEAKKTNWIEVKQTEAVFLKLLWSPGINSASLCPGGPVQQPYSSLVPSPLRLF